MLITAAYLGFYIVNGKTNTAILSHLKLQKDAFLEFVIQFSGYLLSNRQLGIPKYHFCKMLLRSKPPVKYTS
jgi:hypothetical protein